LLGARSARAGDLADVSGSIIMAKKEVHMSRDGSTLGLGGLYRLSVSLCVVGVFSAFAAAIAASPASVAETYWRAMTEGRYEAAYKLLSKQWHKDVTKRMFTEFARSRPEYKRPGSAFSKAAIQKDRAAVAFVLGGGHKHLFLVREGTEWRLAAIDWQMPAAWVERPSEDQRAVLALAESYTRARYARDYAGAYQRLSPESRRALSVDQYRARTSMPAGATAYVKCWLEPIFRAGKGSIGALVVARPKEGSSPVLMYGPLPVEKAEGKWWVSIPPRHPSGGGE